MHKIVLVQVAEASSTVNGPTKQKLGIGGVFFVRRLGEVVRN